jgi:protein-S-isoprenylcysteine O-methyltransferase Ste14
MPFPSKDWIFEKLSAYRGYAYILPFGLMAIITYGEWEQDAVLWLLGFAIVIPGFLIRLWATKHIGRRMPWMKKKGKHLATTGPYALVRNPLYIGNIIIAMGLSIFSELIWFVPLIFFYLLVIYHLVAQFEEKKLSERWGDQYRAYMREVPRWIPKFKRFGEAKIGGFRWRDAFRSEVPSLYVVILAVFIFVLKEFISGMG